VAPSAQAFRSHAAGAQPGENTGTPRDNAPPDHGTARNERYFNKLT